MTLTNRSTRSWLAAVVSALAIAITSTILGAAPAHALVSGDFTYTLDYYGPGGEAGYGARVQAYAGPGGDVVVPETLGGWPVFDIGASAFDGRTDLTSISLPSQLSTIRYQAFRGTTALHSIALPASLATIETSAFEGSGLESVVVPAAVRDVQSSAFKNSTLLETIAFEPGSAVSAIPSEFCKGCTALQTIQFPDGTTTIDDRAFENSGLAGDVSLPSTVTWIGNAAFQGSHLTRIDLGDSIVTIGVLAFADTPTLTEVAGFDAPLQWIGDHAFERSGLTGHITVPATTQMVGDFAFTDTAIDSVTIEDGALAIGTSAFQDLAISGELTIPDSVTSIGNNAFVGNEITSVTLGSGLTSIGYSAFAINEISSLNWSAVDTAVTVGPNAFTSNHLTHLTLPSGVTQIFQGAFSLNHLLSVTLPASAADVSTDGWNDQTWPDGTRQLFGWYDGVPYTGNASPVPSLAGVGGTVYSQWSPVIVTFAANGGTFVNSPNATIATGHDAYGSQELMTSDKIAREGFAFTGWSTSADGHTGLIPGPWYGPITQAAVTLYAQWKPAYVVNFDTLNGYPAPPAQTVVEGETPAEPATQPVAPLARFVGWSVNGQIVDPASAVVGSDITLVAAYEARDTSVPAVAQPGAEIIVNGSGFEPGEEVTVTMHSEPTVLGTVTADALGRISFVATVPPDKAAGSHELEFTGTLTGTSVEMMSVASSGGSLAMTGAEVFGMLAASIACAAAGLALVAVASRRSGRNRSRTAA